MIRRNLEPFASAFILFGVNAFLCRELFSTTYVSCAMSSVEGSFISMSRYAMDNAHDLRWFPLWFGGMPWLNVYQPGLPISVALIAKSLHETPALIYHFLMALFYCLGPVTVFWMCFGITRRCLVSLFVGSIYSLFSPSAAVAIVLEDLGSFWFGHRFQTMTAYGEGPHVAAMTLIPVAVLCFHHALILRKPLYRIVAPICLTLVAITNWTGSVGLTLALICFLLAYFPLLRKTDWLLVIAFGAIAYAIGSPWLPPSAIQTAVKGAQHANGHFPFTGTHLIVLGLLIPTLLGTVWLLHRLRVPEFLQFTGLFAAVTAGIYIVWRIFEFALLPQPHRWLLEMEMGLIPTFAFTVFHASRRLSSKVKGAIVVFTLMFCIIQVANYRYYFRFLLPPIDITQTSEYNEAQWFDQHMGGRRVYAPGSVSLWMNLFTGIPDLLFPFAQEHTPAILLTQARITMASLQTWPIS